MSENTKISGIYLIRNMINGKCYVGSSINIATRWDNHRYHLRTGTHRNIHLQRAWNEYTEAAFEFTVIEPCIEAVLLIREDVWMTYHHSTDRAFGYNLATAERHMHAVETKAKMAAAHTGKPSHPQSQETRAKQAAASKAMWAKRSRMVSQASRDKMSAAKVGKSTWNKGKKLSPEHKANWYKACHVEKGHQLTVLPQVATA